MERVLDLAVRSWIDDGVEQSARPYDKVVGNLVRACVPPIYEAYAKIFHPIFEDPKESVSNETWAEFEDAMGPGDSRVDQILAAAGARTIRVGAEKNADYGDRVLWSELAARYGLAFHAEISDYSFVRHMPGRSFPRRLQGPSEGTLDKPHALQLAEILSTVGEERCFFAYSPIAAIYVSNPPIFLALPRDIAEIIDQDSQGFSPEYWWPESRRWCVCTDWDLTFTLVGGTREVVVRILDDDLFESIEVGPSTRVDWYSDRLNFPISERTRKGTAREPPLRTPRPTRRIRRMNPMT